MRLLTRGDFEHEPRRRSGNPADPVLDVNALAKGWIIEEAAVELRLNGATDFFINAGGDVLAQRSPQASPWRVGIQHPTRRDAAVAVFELASGAVATSGSYERGRHIRTESPNALLSVTVVGPDLAEADALSTAVYAAGAAAPPWWDAVDTSYGLLTIAEDAGLKWFPPLDSSPGIALVAPQNRTRM